MAAAEPIFTSEDGRYVPGELARGPWSPDAQHGGAPAALIAREVERVEGPPFVARVTFEFVREVPLAPLEVSTEVVRPGRRVQLVAASLRAEDREVCRALALRIRRTDEPLSEALGDEPPPEGPDGGRELDVEGRFRRTFIEAFDQRFTVGAYDAPGPATVWMRLRGSLVDDEAPSPLVRACATADFGNGVSSALDWDTHLFVNPDLTVYLDRPVQGEWVCLDATTRIDPHGTGNAESALFDRTGRIGRSVQSLYVDRREG